MSENTIVTTKVSARSAAPANATFTNLASLSICHLLNDMNQSLLPAIYPILKDSYHLDFGQIGLITLAFQLTASMLQPVVGMVTDRRPQPFSLSVVIGLILASAFSAILVYAQDLMPGRVGMVAGIFYGFSFGLGGLGAAALGQIADLTSIETVYRVCSFLPLIGLLTAFLPNLARR